MKFTNVLVLIVVATIFLVNIVSVTPTGDCNDEVTYSKGATGGNGGTNMYTIEFLHAEASGGSTEFCYRVSRSAGGNALSNLVFDIRERDCVPVVTSSSQTCISGNCASCSGAGYGSQSGSCGGCSGGIIKFDDCNGGNGAWVQEFCFTLSGEHWLTKPVYVFPKGGSADPTYLPSICGPVGSYDECDDTNPTPFLRGGCDVDLSQNFNTLLGNHHDGQLCRNTGKTPYGLRIDNFKALGFGKGHHVFSFESYVANAYDAEMFGEYTAPAGPVGAKYFVYGTIYGGKRGSNGEWKNPRYCQFNMSYFGGEIVNSEHVSWNSDNGAEASGRMSCDGHAGYINLVAEACRVQACDGELFFIKKNHRQSYTVQERWGAAGWVDIVGKRTKDVRDTLFTLGHCFTDQPTQAPTPDTPVLTPEPTVAPTDEPTEAPTVEPTDAPTKAPTPGGCELNLYEKWSAKLGDFAGVRDPPHGFRLDDLNFTDGVGRYHYSFEHANADVHGHYVPPSFGHNAWFRIDGDVYGGRIKDLTSGEWLNSPAEVCQLQIHFKKGKVTSNTFVEWNEGRSTVLGTLTCGTMVLGLRAKANGGGQYFFISRNFEDSFVTQGRWGATGWTEVIGDEEHDGFRDLIFTFAECREFDPPCLADLTEPFTTLLGDHAGVTQPPHGLRIDDMDFLGTNGRWHFSFEISNPAYPTASVTGVYTPPSSEDAADAKFVINGQVLGGTITYNIGWNMPPVLCDLEYTYENGNLRNDDKMVEWDLGNDATGTGTLTCNGEVVNLGAKANPGNQTFFITKDWDGTWDVQRRWGATGWVTVAHDLYNPGHRDFIFSLAPCVPSGPPSPRYPGRVKASVRFPNLKRGDFSNTEWAQFLADFMTDIVTVLDIDPSKLEVYGHRHGGGLIIDMWIYSPCDYRDSCTATNLASSLELRQELGNLVAHEDSILYADDRLVTKDLDPTFFEGNTEDSGSDGNFLVTGLVGAGFVAIAAVILVVVIRRRGVQNEPKSNENDIVRSSSDVDLLPSLFQNAVTASGSDESSTNTSDDGDKGTMRYLNIANATLPTVSQRNENEEHYMAVELENLRNLRTTMNMEGGAPDIE